MRLNRPGALAAGFGVLLLLGGCWGSGGGPVGPVVSPTGIVYDPGIPPVETRYSQTAALYLRSGELDRASEIAREGIEADPDNPIHYFLAGVADARAGRYEDADANFAEAQRLYPAYELDIEPEREAAWAEAFNQGVEAFAAGEEDEAIEAWRGAAAIFDLRPEAHRNLAMLYYGEGQYDEAVDIYQRALAGLEQRPATRVLGEDELSNRAELMETMEASLADLLLVTNRFAEAEPLLRRQLRADSANVQVRQNLALALSAQDRHEEAAEIYSELLSEGGLEATQLFNLGVALFRAGDYVQAAEAFERLIELRPHSRDAWFNYANSLFAAEAWEVLVSAGARLLELDPLNENAALIAARAHLETGDDAAALRGLEQIEAAPVHVEALIMRPAPVGTSLQGRVTGNKADPGETIQLRFTFYEEERPLGIETVTVAAPPSGESEAFEVSFERRATAYRYELSSTPR